MKVLFVAGLADQCRHSERSRKSTSAHSAIIHSPPEKGISPCLGIGFTSIWRTHHRRAGFIWVHHVPQGVWAQSSSVTDTGCPR